MKWKILNSVILILFVVGCSGADSKKEEENLFLNRTSSELSSENESKDKSEEINSRKYGPDSLELTMLDDVLYASLFYIKNDLGAAVSVSNDETVELILEKNKQKTKVVFKLNNIYFSQVYTNEIRGLNLINKLEVPIKRWNNDIWVPLFAVTDSFGFEVELSKDNQMVKVDTSNKGIKPKEGSFQYDVDGNIFYLHPLEIELFYLTNKEREEKHVAPLMLDIKSSEVARIKSKDLHDYEYFEHESAQLGDPFEMLEKEKVSFVYAGENLAAGYNTAEEVMRGWMESEGHKENILRSEFERVGFGMFVGEKGFNRYYTQIFTSR